MQISELTENNVIDAVCSYLDKEGYIIEQRLNTTQKGIDIIASREGLRNNKICIEAKGATSARKNSFRYGKPFESAAIRVHVAEAIFKALQISENNMRNDNIQVGIAFPDENVHKKLIGSVMDTLHNLNVAIFWVNEKKELRTENLNPR